MYGKGCTPGQYRMSPVAAVRWWVGVGSRVWVCFRFSAVAWALCTCVPVARSGGRGLGGPGLRGVGLRAIGACFVSSGWRLLALALQELPVLSFGCPKLQVQSAELPLGGSVGAGAGGRWWLVGAFLNHDGAGLRECPLHVCGEVVDVYALYAGVASQLLNKICRPHRVGHVLQGTQCLLYRVLRLMHRGLECGIVGGKLNGHAGGGPCSICLSYRMGRATRCQEVGHGLDVGWELCSRALNSRTAARRRYV